MDLPVVRFRNQKAWQTWLARHFDSSPRLWLKVAKKSAALQSVTFQDPDGDEG